MDPKHIYYNISDSLHAVRLEQTLYDNAMSEDQADGVQTFLESLEQDTPLNGDLPIRLVSIQGDAGTGKTQAIVSLCQMLNCPIVVGSTNPSSVNVAQRCRSAFPYNSCVQTQLSGTFWAGLHWNIRREMIGTKQEDELFKIYEECVRTRRPPTAEQDKEIYSLLNKVLFRKMRDKFNNECELAPQNTIYAAWESARTGSGSFIPKQRAMQELYEMFCSVPQGEMTQEDFNAALAFRCLTAFSETLPRPLLTNFMVLEEAARLPGYFWRIQAYYHYMVRFRLKPPGYRTSMLTICLMGSPLQSTVIKFPDFSVMDEAVLDAKRRNTHISVYTVNRRTRTVSLKDKALATVVHVLENDCPLQQEHCQLLQPFVVPETSFMDPRFAPSAMRLTHYHKRVIEFTNKANSEWDDIIIFCEHLLVSECVQSKTSGTNNEIMHFLDKNGATVLPYRSSRAKDIMNEGVLEALQPVVLDLSEDNEPLTYRLFSIKRILGKNTPVSIQYNTRLTPVEFSGTYRSFYNSATLCLSCSEQLWSLRISLSFANILLSQSVLTECEVFPLALAIDDVWVSACRYAKELSKIPFNNVEERAAITAGLTEIHDYLWQAVVKVDNVGFLDMTLNVRPFCGGKEPHRFPEPFLAGDRFPETLTLTGAVELTPSEIIASRMRRCPMSDYKADLCYEITKALRDAIWDNTLQVHDLLLRAPTGILFRTVNILSPERWCAVFPKEQFRWNPNGGADNGQKDDCLAAKAKSDKKQKKQAMAGTQQGYPDSSEEGCENAISEDEGDCEDEDENENEPCRQEASSIVHMLHTIYDSRVRTIDSVQGETISCGTLVDVQSIQTMGQLTVALTRNTIADNLMLTSSDITGIPVRDPITKFVRLSARDTPCYYVK